jgi:carboxylate-amine ligase
MWWDARPHPRLGTLEIRIADQQTDVRRSAAFAALLQALAADALEREQEPVDRDEYAERRLRAARGDLPLDGLRAAVEQAARGLATHETVTELLAAPPEADLQLAVGRAHGVEAVAADVAERSLESL